MDAACILGLSLRLPKQVHALPEVDPTWGGEGGTWVLLRIITSTRRVTG